MITAKGLAEAMTAMNCKAMGIAAQDLAGGIELLKEIQDKQLLTWLSMNLVDNEKKQPIFTPSINTKVNDIDITILGLTDEKFKQADNPEYTILPWQEVLPDVLAEVDNKTDMIIVLSSYPEWVNREIANTVQGIDLILQSGHTNSNQNPLRIHDTLLARVAHQGKYVGMMRISWTKAEKWGENYDAQIRAEQNKLDRIDWQIGRLKKRAQRKNVDLNKDERYTQLLSEREKSEKKIVEIKNTSEKAVDIEPCSFTNRFIPLESSMPEDKEIQAIIDRVTLEVNKLNRKRVRTTGKQLHPSLSLLTDWTQCNECHPAQTAFWQTTDHANAFNSLEKVDKQFNEDCLICHVTLPYYDLARVKSEKLLLQLPQYLKGVGCESCHGPAAAHSKQPESVATVSPDEDTCKGCHTPDRDDNFIFAEKLLKVRCPKG